MRKKQYKPWLHGIMQCKACGIRLFRCNCLRHAILARLGMMKITKDLCPRHKDLHNGIWKLNQRSAARRELLCPHGVGHHKGVHGCDGCCNIAPNGMWEQVTKD